MKRVLRLCPVLLVLFSTLAFAANRDETAVRTADQRRIQATVGGNIAELGKLLSDELLYAHADGRVQSKAQYITAIATNQTKYVSVEPQDVTFQSVDTDAATLSGRAKLTVESNGRQLSFTLRFLAVWRREDGHWRLLAYQSCQLEAPH
jgi:hypothetical protein